MKQLWPPLDSIERQLFEPSDELIRRWMKDPSKLDNEIAEQLRTNALAREKRDAYLSAKATGGIETLDPETIRPRQIPSEIFSLIKRRQQSAQANFSHTPSPGQIRLIESLIGPHGSTGIDLANPLAVLLVEPTEHPSVWYGFGVSGETDYAGYWDMLLEGEVDTPFDPMAGMIQVWNPTYLYLSSSTDLILAQLSDHRMIALQSLSREYLLGEETDPADADPGVHIVRWIDGYRVLTGSPLGGQDDPRVRYQQLYQATFETVSTIAKSLFVDLQHAESRTDALDTASNPLLNQLGNNIRQWADKLNLTWEPTPALATAMSGNRVSQSRFCLQGQLLFQFVEREVRGVILIEVHLTFVGVTPLKVVPIENTVELPGYELTQDSPNSIITFSIDTQGEIAVSGDALSFVIPITPITPV